MICKSAAMHPQFSLLLADDALDALRRYPLPAQGAWCTCYRPNARLWFRYSIYHEARVYIPGSIDPMDL